MLSVPGVGPVKPGGVVDIPSGFYNTNFQIEGHTRVPFREKTKSIKSKKTIIKKEV